MPAVFERLVGLAEIRIVDLSSFIHVMWWNNGVLSAAACPVTGHPAEVIVMPGLLLLLLLPP